VHAASYPASHSRRTLLPDLVRSLRPTILDLGLASEQELDQLDQEARQHLADSCTLMMPHLLVVTWGRKPPASPAGP
jgi:hypothetical protein